MKEKLNVVPNIGNTEVLPTVSETDEKSSGVHLLLEPHDRPKSIAQWLMLSIQHVFAMFGSTVLVPMIINQTAGMEVMNVSMALFCSGIGTLIYIACTAAKVPMYLGSSFAYMAAIGSNYPSYGNAVFIAVMIAGLIYIAFGVAVYFAGSDFVGKILPAVVVGPIIVVIGMGVAPSAITNSGLNPGTWTGTYSHWIGVAIAFFTVFITVIASLKFKGFAKMIPVLIGVIAGYLLSVILHFSNPDWEILETAKITDTNTWEWHPTFKAFWQLNPKDIGPAILAISPLAIIAIAEHVGEHISLGYLTGKNFVKNPGMHRTLVADGISIVIDGFIGGPPNTTYGENTSVVGMTRVASVWVTGLAAIFAIILSFIAPVNQLIQMMPGPVMGGISMIMFGFIATNGIRVLINNKIDYKNMRNVFITSFILVLGLGQAVLGTQQIKFEGTALAAFGGIILNLILPRTLNEGFFSWNYLTAKIKTKRAEKQKSKKK